MNTPDVHSPSRYLSVPTQAAQDLWILILHHPRRDHTHVAPELVIMPELDPQIWSKLPHDILFNVIDCLDRPDWKEWSCVSRAFFTYASARIWRTIRIGACHIGTSRSLVKSEVKGHCEALQHDILHRLTHNSYSKLASPVFQAIREDTPMHIYHPNVEYPEKTLIGLSRIPASLPGSWVFFGFWAVVSRGILTARWVSQGSL